MQNPRRHYDFNSVLKPVKLQWAFQRNSGARYLHFRPMSFFNIKLSSKIVSERVQQLFILGMFRFLTFQWFIRFTYYDININMYNALINSVYSLKWLNLSDLWVIMKTVSILHHKLLHTLNAFIRKSIVLISMVWLTIFWT